MGRIELPPLLEGPPRDNGSGILKSRRATSNLGTLQEQWVAINRRAELERDERGQISPATLKKMQRIGSMLSLAQKRAAN